MQSDHELPTKSLPISRMSDSITGSRRCQLGDITVHLKDPMGRCRPISGVLFAEETVTLASLFDKDFFVGMMLSVATPRNICHETLRDQAMAWVWAMLKLDFDPDGTPVTRTRPSAIGAGRWAQTSRRSSPTRYGRDLARHQVRRRRYGRSTMRTHSSVAALYANGLPGSTRPSMPPA